MNYTKTQNIHFKIISKYYSDINNIPVIINHNIILNIKVNKY